MAKSANIRAASEIRHVQGTTSIDGELISIDLNALQVVLAAKYSSVHCCLYCPYISLSPFHRSLQQQHLLAQLATNWKVGKQMLPALFTYTFPQQGSLAQACRP